eukprot:gene19301-37203_t
MSPMFVFFGSSEGWWNAYQAGIAVVVASTLSPVATALATGRMPLPLCEAVMCVSALGVLSIDWALAATPDAMRTWAGTVVVVDLALVMKMSHRITQFVLAVTLLWLVINASERRDIVACVFDVAVYSLIFVCDYIITRGFASSVRCSTSLAQVVAQALARYDLAAANNALVGEDAARLPNDLRHAYATLIVNLSWVHAERARLRLFEQINPQHTQNRLAFTDAVGSEVISAVSDWLALEIEDFCDRLRDHGGVLDLASGDHRTHYECVW